MANDFDHVSPRDLGRDVRVQSSPAGCAMNIINDYGVMMPLRLEQALALRDWLNEYFPRDAVRVNRSQATTTGNADNETAE